jgi:hypothetical protein
MIVMGCCCSRPDHCALGVSNQLTECYTWESLLKAKILLLFNLAVFGRKYYSLYLRLVLCALSALEAWHADLILYVCCGLRLCFGFESCDKVHRELRHATVRVGPTSGSEPKNLARRMFVIPENGPWRFLNAPWGMWLVISAFNFRAP